ncbi:hypothetical protein GCM10010512_37050 [Streptomyces thermoviolaceus subsp. thermoviolaceus]|nr:hypothetical protein GCM10010512_37050 [Streptomyces thermoviolaceus subsp. thermoviolaceus]
MPVSRSQTSGSAEAAVLAMVAEGSSGGAVGTGGAEASSVGAVAGRREGLAVWHACADGMQRVAGPRTW